MKEIPTTPFTLPATNTWPKTQHQFESDSIDAIMTAMYVNRPLLIRGETGAGKSQLARAIAITWGRVFLSTVVNSRSDSQDLHYQFDAVARLADAQVAGKFISEGDKEALRSFLNPLKYVKPSVLWWVFDWEKAADITKIEGNNGQERTKPIITDEKGKQRKWEPKDGAVVLIDEIDKAETDLPNDLLETLGNGAFNVPWIDKPIKMQSQKPPLVVITTNDERELPAAFVRRCIVLDLNPPKTTEKLRTWLCERGAVHFADQCSPTIREEAANLVIENRDLADKKGVHPPGQAEYIDLLKALCEQTKGLDIQERDKIHKALIHKITPYVLKKYPEMKEA